MCEHPTPLKPALDTPAMIGLRIVPAQVATANAGVARRLPALAAHVQVVVRVPGATRSTLEPESLWQTFCQSNPDDVPVSLVVLVCLS